MDFKKGDRVIYTSFKFGESEINPAANTSYECSGTIIKINGGGHYSPNINVKWDNGETNSYRMSDLSYAPDDISEINPNQIFKRLKLKKHLSAPF